MLKNECRQKAGDPMLLLLLLLSDVVVVVRCCCVAGCWDVFNILHITSDDTAVFVSCINRVITAVVFFFLICWKRPRSTRMTFIQNTSKIRK